MERRRCALTRSRTDLGDWSGQSGEYTKFSVSGGAVPAQGVAEGATDLPADKSTGGVVEVDGFGARAAIHEPIHRPDNYRDLDTDWFAVELKAGRTYRIDMKGAILVAPGTYADDELTLFLPQINAIYDADGDYLFNTWSRDESSAHHLFRVTFHAHAGGTYYIAASGESFEWGGYELTVVEVTDGPERMTPHTKTDRANGVKYIFWVKAPDDNGHGPTSEEVSVTPTSGSAVDLGTPVLSEPETLHHGMVKLDWDDIEGAGWYVVQYYHVKSGEWLDLPAAGVDIAFHGSSAVLSNLDWRIAWFRVWASCAGSSEWSQIVELYVNRASDWEDVPVPVVEAGDEIEPCPEDPDTPDNSPATGAPTITGTAQVGEALAANTTGIADSDGPADVSYTYQWLADDTDIAGATGSTYTLSTADEGKAIKVRVTFTDDAGNEETLTSADTAAVAAAPQPNNPATGAPAISGTAQVGETLTADTTGIADDDGLENVSFSYQWLSDDAAIFGATANTYTLADSDEGKTVTVQVSFTDDAGNAEAVTSGATDTVASKPNNPATGAPAITGTAQVGETLTADTSGIADENGLENVSFSYQWLADDAEIAGATGLTYTLTDADEGKAVKVRVSFTDDADNDETLTSGATAAVAAKPNSPATGAPAITGTAQVGETLTADTSGITDDDGLENVSFSYQWLADDAEIAGATGLTYTLSAADEGKAVKVRVSFTDDADNDETLTSGATDAVAAPELPAKPRAFPPRRPMTR